MLDNLEIQRFDPQNHIKDLDILTRSRGMPDTKFWDIPDLGFIAHDSGQPVALAFLRECEGNIGILDSLITHPEAPSAQRHQAIDSIVSKLISTAKELKFNRIIAFSVDAGTLLRSEKHGFTPQPHAVISLSL